tara:strand:- start:1923 stop:2207 length:285 start_codon:yes stop_codon:yes gene_type:complete
MKERISNILAWFGFFFLVMFVSEFPAWHYSSADTGFSTVTTWSQAQLVYYFDVAISSIKMIISVSDWFLLIYGLFAVLNRAVSGRFRLLPWIKK